ncbi:MAG: class I tRNA ligase family protein, partial [Patescibacteria group bacterium]
FWKFMADVGLIDKSLGQEPFLKLRAPGWILGPDSRKMSKRWGNVVTPDDVIPKYGADTLRMYEMFMGPFDAMKPWSLTGVEGMNRFIHKVWRLVNEISNFQFPISNKSDSREVYKRIHQTIKRVTEDIEELKFNTAIAALMEYVNFLQELLARLKEGGGAIKPRDTGVIRCAELEEAKRTLLLLLAPFAPHMTEELCQQSFGSTKFEARNSKINSIHQQLWPEYNPDLIVEKEVEIPVQVNGKLRGTIKMPNAKCQMQNEVEALAKADQNISKHLTGDIKKVIFVPGKLINFVTNS